MRLPSFRELSSEQDIIYNLPLDKNYLVTGPPGTGKTVIALYRASMYRKRNKTPKLLSYSKVLSSYTDDAARNLQINGYVSTYHSWVYQTYRGHTGQEPPVTSPFVYDWGQIMEGFVMNELPRKPCLLIDEGQDLPPVFYAAASLMAEHLTVFADENQRITDTQSTITDIRTNAMIRDEHTLTRNYRNSYEIARAAACFYTGLPTGIPALPTRRGDLPVIQQTRNLDDFIALLLRFEQNNSDLEIGVFTQVHEMQELLLAKLEGRTKRKAEFYHSKKKEMPSFGQPGIKLLNFKSAKGLEFDAVFIPEMQEMNLRADRPVDKMTLYVMLSRAREQLFLLYSGVKPRILDILPDDCYQQRKS